MEGRNTQGPIWILRIVKSHAIILLKVDWLTVLILWLSPIRDVTLELAGAGCHQSVMWHRTGWGREDCDIFSWHWQGTVVICFRGRSSTGTSPPQPISIISRGLVLHSILILWSLFSLYKLFLDAQECASRNLITHTRARINSPCHSILLSRGTTPSDSSIYSRVRDVGWQTMRNYKLSSPNLTIYVLTNMNSWRVSLCVP